MLQLSEIAAFGAPYKDKAEAETLMGEYLSAGGSEGNELYKKVKSVLDDPNATQSQLDVAMKAMLESVGKELPQNTEDEGQDAKYTFDIESNPLESVDDTPVPTVAPGNDEDVDEKTDNKKDSAKAAVIAGIAIAAAACAIAAIVIISRKKKKADK